MVEVASAEPAFSQEDNLSDSEAERFELDDFTIISSEVVQEVGNGPAEKSDGDGAALPPLSSKKTGKKSKSKKKISNDPGDDAVSNDVSGEEPEKEKKQKKDKRGKKDTTERKRLKRTRDSDEEEDYKEEQADDEDRELEELPKKKKRNKKAASEDDEDLEEDEKPDKRKRRKDKKRAEELDSLASIRRAKEKSKLKDKLPDKSKESEKDKEKEGEEQKKDDNKEDTNNDPTSSASDSEPEDTEVIPVSTFLSSFRPSLIHRTLFDDSSNANKRKSKFGESILSKRPASPLIVPFERPRPTPKPSSASASSSASQPSSESSNNGNGYHSNTRSHWDNPNPYSRENNNTTFTDSFQDHNESQGFSGEPHGFTQQWETIMRMQQQELLQHQQQQLLQSQQAHLLQPHLMPQNLPHPPYDQSASSSQSQSNSHTARGTEGPPTTSNGKHRSSEHKHKKSFKDKDKRDKDKERRDKEKEKREKEKREKEKREKEKKDKKKKKDKPTLPRLDPATPLYAQKRKEFKLKISETIGKRLKKYLTADRITSKEDFKHLARKFTHKIMTQEDAKAVFSIKPNTEEKVHKVIDAFFERHKTYSRSKEQDNDKPTTTADSDAGMAGMNDV